jgi:hypothetical protein
MKAAKAQARVLSRLLLASSLWFRVLMKVGNLTVKTAGFKNAHYSNGDSCAGSSCGKFRQAEAISSSRERPPTAAVPNITVAAQSAHRKMLGLFALGDDFVTIR